MLFLLVFHCVSPLRVSRGRKLCALCRARVWDAYLCRYRRWPRVLVLLKWGTTEKLEGKEAVCAFPFGTKIHTLSSRYNIKRKRNCHAEGFFIPPLGMTKITALFQALLDSNLYLFQ